MLLCNVAKEMLLKHFSFKLLTKQAQKWENFPNLRFNNKLDSFMK